MEQAQLPDAFYNGWYPDKGDNRHRIKPQRSPQLFFPDRGIRFMDLPYREPYDRAATTGQCSRHPGIGGESASEWIYEQPNNVSLPAYHRLDLGVNFRSTTTEGMKGYGISAFITLIAVSIPLRQGAGRCQTAVSRESDGDVPHTSVIQLHIKILTDT